MYVAAGFAPVPVWGVRDGACTCGHNDCNGIGKHPVGGGWQKRAKCDIDVARDLFLDHRGNIGIVVGDDHVVIDIDGYHGGYDGVTQLPPMPPTLTNGSGSGQGEHRIFRLAPGQDPTAITNRNVARGVDVKIRTGQIVVAPSLHKSGNRYHWKDCTPPAFLPFEIYEAIKKPNVIPLRPEQHRARPSGADTGALLRRAKAYFDKIPPGVEGAGGGTACFRVAAAAWSWIEKGLSEADAWMLFLEYAARCDPPWADERQLQHKWKQGQQAQRKPIIEDRPWLQHQHPDEPPRAAAPASAPIDDADAEPPPRADDDAPPPRAPDGGGPGSPPPGEDESSWRSMLIYDRRKAGPDAPAKHHENALIAFKFCPAWKGKVRLDVHAQRMYVTNPPWHDWHLPAEVEVTREWTDADDTRASSWIRREIPGLTLTRDQCHHAAVVVAEANKFHPFRDYLDSLNWDGQSGLDSWLQTVFGAAPVEPGADWIVSAMGRWWMIGAVARTYRPGCKMDNMLVLEGPQGLKKSSALKLLAGERFFTDTPVDIGSKDAYMALQGKIIVELAELTSLHGAKRDAAKAFFSSASDRYRPPYARYIIDVPRMSVFAGTVNPGAYLTDDTGNRRYFPVQCSKADLEYLAKHREQLWAEAVVRFKAGERWWPDTPEEFAALEAEQLVREETDPWMDAVGAWLQGRDECTTHEVLEGACKLPVEDMTRQHEQRAAKVLRQYHFTRKRKVRHGVQQWVFIREQPMREPGQEG